MARSSPTYIWFYDLDEYHLVRGSNRPTYIARVRPYTTFNMDSIINEIIADRTSLSRETITKAVKLISEEIREQLCKGNTVVTGVAIYRPVITGTFPAGAGEFDKTRHKCTVNITPSRRLRDETKKVKAKFTGYVRESGGARITLVTDMETGKTDGTITPHGRILVAGKKIRCLNADGSANGKVNFIRAETGEVVASLTDLITNETSKLVFVVPALPAGNYILRIETYYSQGNLLKNLRQIEYSAKLKVADFIEPDSKPDIPQA